MTRWVDQTTFGFPGGNCFSACVAGLLGLELAAVPYFMHDDEWWEGFEAWLLPHGLFPLCLSIPKDGSWAPVGVHILSGLSPRGTGPKDLHSVVACGKEIIHDPHPSRAGLVDRRDVVILAQLDPWQEPA